VYILLLEYEILDLGLVLYKNVIKEPGQIIEDLNSLDKRYENKEHGTSFTNIKPWKPWQNESAKTMETFCWQKFLPPRHAIKPSDYYFNEQLSISKKLYESLDFATNHYANTLYPFCGKNIKNREFSIHLLRYEVGGFLPAHIDHGISSRILSTVSYLNDDYEGGEIEFQNSKIKIKPPAGSIIFFPSNFLYVHEVYPITSGSRYSLPHWYHKMREMVYSTGEA
jgi:Rps23 Pro-64 3,4-dihydroxylase Tpa1-like proline 4-hydroxylase